MSESRRTNPVYRTLNKPLTIMGIERTAFFVAAMTGAGFQVLFSSILGALVIFVILVYLGRLVTHKDPKMLLFIQQAIFGAFRPYYDPAKYKPIPIRRIRSRA
jgi:type IV secretory pathway VirB3-like protein